MKTFAKENVAGFGGGGEGGGYRRISHRHNARGRI